MNPLKYLRDLVDAGVEIFSPTTALQRKYARQEIIELSRHAANPNGAWKQANSADTASSESMRAQRERVQMMWEAREIIQNFGFAKAIALKFASYVVGQIVYQADTDDDDFNHEYEDYILAWMLSCDLTGRFDFRKNIELAYLGFKVDGDSSIITPFVDGDIRLQVIQGDRIGNPHQYTYEDKYYSGIMVNDFGQVVGARIYRRTRENLYVDPVVIPAHNFHHMINPMVADQYRGITVMDTGIPTARNIMDIWKAETRAVKTLASQTAIVSSAGNRAGTAWNEKERAAIAEASMRAPQGQEIKPGMINYVANGDNVHAFTYSRPSPAFTGLLQAAFKEFCDAWSADYGFFCDPTGYGGATARLGSKQTQRVFKGEQGIVQARLIDPLIKKKLQYGIAVGHIRPHPRWDKFHIQFPPHATMDEGKDSARDIEEMKMGIKTMEEVLGERSIDVDTHIDRLGREARKIIDTAEKYDVPTGMIQQRTPNGNEEDGEAEAGKSAKPSTKNKAEKIEEELQAIRSELESRPLTKQSREYLTRLEKLEDDLTELRDYKRDENGKFASTGGFGKAYRTAGKIEKRGRQAVNVARDLRDLVKDVRSRRSGRSGNFTIRDPKSKSVRVYFDPTGKGPRQRRNKRFYEKVAFKRKVLKALLAAGVVAGSIAAKHYKNRKTGSPASAPNTATKPSTPSPKKMPVFRPLELPDRTAVPPTSAPKAPKSKKATTRKKADSNYGSSPRPRNRLTTKQRVKFKKKGGQGGSSLSLSKKKDKK